MTEYRCSCIILNYNDAMTTLELLDRIENFQVFERIVIVDNKSTDDSVKLLNKRKTEKIHVIVTEYNGGYGYGNNIGVRYAKENWGCRYALIANPDVEFQENVVQEMIKKFMECEKIAVAAPVQLDINKKEIRDVAWKIPTISQYIYTAESVLGKCKQGFHYPKNYFKDKKIYEVDCVPGSLLMVDVNIFSSIGGYDEEMFLFCEETTLGYKLKQSGYKTILLAMNTYVHKHSVSINRSIKSVRNQKKMLLQSRLIFLKKYLKVNRIQYAIAKVFFGVVSLEQILQEWICKKRK